jgi:hypothetical protein
MEDRRQWKMLTPRRSFAALLQEHRNFAIMTGLVPLFIAVAILGYSAGYTTPSVMRSTMAGEDTGIQGVLALYGESETVPLPDEDESLVEKILEEVREGIEMLQSVF